MCLQQCIRHGRSEVCGRRAHIHLPRGSILPVSIVHSHEKQLEPQENVSLGPVSEPSQVVQGVHLSRSSDSSQNDITISSVWIDNTRASSPRLSSLASRPKTLLHSLLSHTNETLRVRNPVKLRQIAHEIRIRFERNELVVRIATAPFFPISVSHDIAPRRNKEAMADLGLGRRLLTASRSTPCRRRGGKRGLCLCCCALGVSYARVVEEKLM